MNTVHNPTNPPPSAAARFVEAFERDCAMIEAARAADKAAAQSTRAMVDIAKAMPDDETPLHYGAFAQGYRAAQADAAPELKQLRVVRGYLESAAVGMLPEFAHQHVNEPELSVLRTISDTANTLLAQNTPAPTPGALEWPSVIREVVVNRIEELRNQAKAYHTSADALAYGDDRAYARREADLATAEADILNAALAKADALRGEVK